MKEKKGEHPFGDAGQLISLATFLIVWVTDSFFIRELCLNVFTCPVIILYFYTLSCLLCNSRVI